MAVVGVDRHRKGLATIMAAVALAVSRGVGMFGGINGISQQQPSFVAGVTGQRITGVEIQPMRAVGPAVIWGAALAVMMAAIAADGGEWIHDSSPWDMADLTADAHGEMFRVFAGITARREAATMFVAMGALRAGAGSAVAIHLILMISCGIGGVVLEVIGQGVADLAKAIIAGAGIDKATIGVEELDVVGADGANNRTANQLSVNETEMDAAGEGVGDVAIDRDLTRAFIDVGDLKGTATEAVRQDQDQAAIRGAALGGPGADRVLPVVCAGVIFDRQVGELEGGGEGGGRAAISCDCGGGV